MIRLTILAAAGGALGSAARFWLATIAARMTGAGLPWGTILINVLGSFAIGWLAGVSLQRTSPQMQAFAMAGLCGGFTTFSAFSLQTVELLKDHLYGQAAANVMVSVVFCLASTALGFGIAR